MQDWKLALVVGGVALGGVAVGAQCFGARPAQAQLGPYTRCVIVRQESLDAHNDGSIDPPNIDHVVLMPVGWEPIGGGGYVGAAAHMGSVVLCRR